MQNIDSLIRRIRQDSEPAPASRPSTALVVRQEPAIALTPEQVEDVAGTPYSPAFLAAVVAANGKVESVETPDPLFRSITRVSGRTVALPEGADRSALLEEARIRVAAVQVMLRPADEQTVSEWCKLLAASMDYRESASEIRARVRVMISSFDLPACCFTAKARDLVYEACRDSRDGRHEVWFPSYAKARSIIEPLAEPLRSELRRLEALVRVLEGEQDQTKLLAAPTGRPERTPAEVEAWILDIARQPADAFRAAAVRVFRKQLAADNPGLAAAFAPALDALIPVEILPPVKPAARPMNPVMAAWLQEQRRRIRENPGAPIDNETLRRMAELSASQVDLSPPDGKTLAAE